MPKIKDIITGFWSKIKDIITSFPALSEWGNIAKAILPIMKDASATVEEKRKALNMAVNELSEKSFDNRIVVNQIMSIVNMKEQVCRMYADTEAQVKGILSWLPRMEQHKDILIAEVKKHRKQCGINL